MVGSPDKKSGGGCFCRFVSSDRGCNQAVRSLWLGAMLVTFAMAFIAGRSGYNIHAANFFDRLAGLSTVIQGDLIEGETTFPRRMIRFLEFAARPEVNPVALMLAPPGMIELMGKIKQPRIGYTVTEVTRLPRPWRRSLKVPDRLWVPSRWAKEVLIDNGLDRDRIDVVPEGVDGELFNPQASPDPRLAQRPEFKFLHVGKWEQRKSTIELIRCFDELFHDRPAVLVLSVNHLGLTRFDPVAGLKRLKLKAPEKVILVEPIDDHRAMAGLYTACDAFLFPSRSEGWGLPLLEAMACGLPCLGVDYSGSTEFTDREANLLTDYRLRPIDDPDLTKLGNVGVWAEPDWEQFKEYMDFVFTDRDRAAQIGRLAAERARNWTWEKAAQKALPLLEEFAGVGSDSA